NTFVYMRALVLLPMHISLSLENQFVKGPDHPITAIAGKEIVLPCHLLPRISAENMEVRWYRTQFLEVIHLYKDGVDHYEKQMPSYQGRTELLRDGIADGNIALRIYRITPADEGHYSCFIQSSTFYGEAMLELKVRRSSKSHTYHWEYSLMDVTLDPDTAYPHLILSENRKSVEWRSQHRDVPDCPKRFDCVTCVLGYEGFTSGRHYWEIDVGDGINWGVGVARETVSRKGWIHFSPQEGVWAVIPLSLSKSIRKIGIYLDYERGELPGTGLSGTATPGPASKMEQVPLPSPAAEFQTELQKDPSLDKPGETCWPRRCKPPWGRLSVKIPMEKGFLYQEWAPQGEVELWGIGRQLVVPQKYHHRLLYLAHDVPLLGHQGFQCTRQQLLLQNIYWPRVCDAVWQY
uniref:Ig-like domain-containing protein n=1 Tax=Gopherus agassizii TaxID=38772 RepID=A0A452IHN5_9SAUR